MAGGRLAACGRVTCTPPGRLMVSCGDLNTCSSVGQSGRGLPGATPQMKVRLRDWLTPKLPAFSTPNLTCGARRGLSYIAQRPGRCGDAVAARGKAEGVNGRDHASALAGCQHVQLGWLLWGVTGAQRTW